MKAQRKRFTLSLVTYAENLRYSWSRYDLAQQGNIRMTFNKHVFVSSRLILISFVGFLSVQANQSVYSTENTSRSLALASEQFTFYKMCLKTHVDSTFLMNTRIPGSLLLELEISAIPSLISCI